MLNMNNEEALGIIFPNSYDSLIPELVSERLMILCFRAWYIAE